jgi:mono/diheme cytochrome c family protein
VGIDFAMTQRMEFPTTGARVVLASTVLLASVHLATMNVHGDQAGGATKTAVKPLPSTPKSIAAGASLFRAHCRACHGNDGKGNGPEAPRDSKPADLTDSTWAHGSTDAEIFEVIRSGVGPKFDMKGFRSRLTAEEMWSLVHYVRSIGPQGAR